jgi:hypothetical protein
LPKRTKIFRCPPQHAWDYHHNISIKAMQQQLEEEDKDGESNNKFSYNAKTQGVGIQKGRRWKSKNKM